MDSHDISIGRFLPQNRGFHFVTWHAKAYLEASIHRNAMSNEILVLVVPLSCNLTNNQYYKR